MPEHVSIAYRGANYAIGQGPQFYGIWPAAGLQSAPIEWWPLTPEGWSGAWARFASIEVPGTIGPVPPLQPVTHAVAPGAGTGPSAGAVQPSQSLAAASATKTPWIAAVILGLGVVLGIASLFPAYVAGASVASQSSNLVTHVSYLTAWALSAVLIVSGRGRVRAGALLGVGVSAVTLGLFLADLGTPLASGLHLAGTGLVLGMVGWLGCTIGALLALRASLADGTEAAPKRRLARHLGRSSSFEIVPLVALVLAAVGAAIAFAPSWDSFKLTTANGASQVVTLGNAFANPGPVILGDVLVMVALVAVIVVAALWRPTFFGGALAAGAIVPMVAQAISAIVMLHEPTSPLQFGISQSQASQLGLTIDAGLTPMFWVFCAFVATMILLCVWMLVSRESTPEQAWPYRFAPDSGAPATVTGVVSTGVASTGVVSTGTVSQPAEGQPAGS